MATVVEQRSHSHLGGMGGYSHYPQFTNPWATNNLPSPHAQMYHGHMSPAHEYAQDQRTVTTSMGYAPPAPTSMAPDMQARAYNTTYAPQPATPQGVYPPTSAPRYSPEQQYPYAFDRRQQPYPTKPQLNARDSFNDALDASQGMVAMSQDMTPRNIYQGRNGSQDSYGFPAHSHTSSISSSSGYPTYYQSSYSGSYSGSVDGNSSVTDYSSASEDALNSRTLPAPGSQMVGSFPPEPTTMMSQFNSKLAPSAQKKHKCKICDKRFTRPSSLQTHMYSHTGEKPFVCDHEGCGRHFSVVSNLRRHKKVHKNSNEHPSPDEE